MLTSVLFIFYRVDIVFPAGGLKYIYIKITNGSRSVVHIKEELRTWQKKRLIG